jgi:hypothetical protein
MKIREAVLGNSSGSVHRQALREQLIPWVEYISTFVNAAIIALCLALMGSFWFAKITPLFILIFGLPILCVLGYGLFYKGKLIRKPLKIAGMTWFYVILLGTLISSGVYLRYPTSAHIHGGLDQGSYFNIAAWIANHGTYERHDTLLEDAFRKKWPFAFNLLWNPYQSQGKPQQLIPGEYEGERFVGGFTIKDTLKGKVVPQFFPLASLLLATGHWMFGGKHAADILPIFGILSVISAGLLAYRMFKSAFVAVLVFLTLLFSGIEVFFSTFPVSEIISQYFLMTGMWFVLRAIDDEGYSLPLLASFNFTIAFFNHVSSIFYLAPVVAFFALHRVAFEERIENRQMLLFFYTFLVGLTLSLLSARIYNGFYLYRNIVKKLPFLEPVGVPGLFLLLFALIFLAALIPFILNVTFGKALGKKADWTKWTLFSATTLLTLSIAVKLVLVKLQIISLEGRTYTYFSSITTHISWIGWFLLMWGILAAIFRKRDQRFLLPLLVLLWFSFLFLFLSFSTEYQWYFARYYVKEFLPLAIIWMAYGIYQFSEVGFFRGVHGKAISVLLGLLLVLYSAHPNLYTFKKPFLEGAFDAMANLNSKIKDHGIVLLVPGSDKFAPPDSEQRLSVPLVYYFDHDVIWLPLKSDLAKMVEIIAEHLRKYDRHLYLLYIGRQPLPGTFLPQGTRYITSQMHRFTTPERAYHIPKKVWEFQMGLHLYELSL